MWQLKEWNRERRLEKKKGLFSICYKGVINTGGAIKLKLDNYQI